MGVRLLRQIMVRVMRGDVAMLVEVWAHIGKGGGIRTTSGDAGCAGGGDARAGPRGRSEAGAGVLWQGWRGGEGR